MPGSPYDEIPPMQRWSTAAASISDDTFDPQGRSKFQVAPDEAVASAGSGLGSRIAELLLERSTNYIVAEPPPKWLSTDDARRFAYVPFSARYGSISSTLQLLQLFERAYGIFDPIETAWEAGDAFAFVDPFRPRISPEPFASIAELERDRTQHLKAVRRLFETVGVFVFTMSDTEIWRDRRDGAVYPVCPGVAGGRFDPAKHEFHNASLSETRRDLESFASHLAAVNPAAKLVLIVSPEPAGATLEPQHVARATTYSKSVLRVAADEVSRGRANVDYFAAYEMASQTIVASDAFEADRLTINVPAADRIARAFAAHYLGDDTVELQRAPLAIDPLIACDEDLFAR